jgi:hypothetical protein
MKCEYFLLLRQVLHLTVPSKNFPRGTLIECVKRQPDILFPAKISSRPVDHLEKKHLIRALTGNYGYVKAPVGQSLSIEEASVADSIGMDSVDSTQAERLTNSRPSSIGTISVVGVYPFSGPLK